MRKFHTESYNAGKLIEVKYLPCLQKAFNDEALTHTKKKCDIFDFVSVNKFIEIKKRNFDYSKYPDTMIGLNKINYAKENPDKEFYFVFVFNDGLYYWKYNDEDKLNYRKGGRYDRGYNEIKDYCYIPINLLKNISIDNINEL